MFTNFNDIFAFLRSGAVKKRMVAAWGVDDHTISAASKAIEYGLVDVTLVGDKDMIISVCEAEGIDPGRFSIVHEPVEMKAIDKAVAMVKAGEGDFLMKGLCSTDKFLRAVIHKEKGILPPKSVLSHVGVLENPNYHKLMFVGDMAVIPAPDLSQKIAIMKYLVSTAHAMGITTPKVAVIAATEQMSVKMPACVDAAIISKMVERGQVKGCIADGPLALDVAIDMESVQIKGMSSPVAGDADCLLFPNIESANVFYKTNSKLASGVKQAGMAIGEGMPPCVLSSRADSTETKLNSIAIAAMAAR